MKMIDTSEKNFEASIESLLLSLPRVPSQNATGEGPSSLGDFVPGGFRKSSPEDYDRSLCLLPNEVIDFLKITQPKALSKLEKNYSGDARQHFLELLSKEIRLHGTLYVLRHGIKDFGIKFNLVYFPPASQINPETQYQYRGNIFTIVRQLKYSQKNERSLDLVIFLNGLPIFTAEIKNPFTGQVVTNAIQQYRQNRDPREPLFAFRRCLAHFAVDPDLVYFTTHLEGPSTRFIPFNRGKNQGAGNPPIFDNFSTAYLWDQVWARDSILNLLQFFIQEYEEEDDEGKKTGNTILIFPRYHQLDCVRRILSHSKKHGTGQSYLIQHSAGSGKSNSIAWLAHQLSVLHNDQDQAIFDSVVIITDRRILDRQLQYNVRQFEQVLGTVENIDKTSRQLKKALEDGKKIIVTTLQKFPMISKEMQALSGSRFAVIIDEAHSSQSGEASRHLNTVLSVKSLDDAEREDSKGEVDLDDVIITEIKKRGHLPNASYFAFTATPKRQTLQLFGSRQQDGSYKPFSLYSMRQAIEEGFILDVLSNYTTYKTYWNLLKKVSEDKRYDKTKATRLLLNFVDLHEHTINKKVAIILEHFKDEVYPLIDHHAKAMIVTRSRLHAVRYKHAVDEYIRDNKLPFKALVAFSGTVRDSGIDYTEVNMNGFPETQTARVFKQDVYRILIVAEKFQTGFDQPLLHTMYVDKKLKGLHAVQTLSRLNRICPPNKKETFVLDFANEAAEIQLAFEPYYQATILSEGLDPNVLYDLQIQMEGFHWFLKSDVGRFASIYFSPTGDQSQFHAILQPAVDAYKSASKDDQVKFRSTLLDYNRLYSFLSQVMPFQDPDLESLYRYASLLYRKLPVDREQLPIEIMDAIDLGSLVVQKTSDKRRIKLEGGKEVLEPETPLSTINLPQVDLEPLSVILDDLNKRFGTDFTDNDRVVLYQLEQQLIANPNLGASLKANVNNPENARLTFSHELNDLLQTWIDKNFKFYKQYTDNPDFARALSESLFNRFLESYPKGVSPSG
jgi:type I restriction enzyme R subunit